METIVSEVCRRQGTQRRCSVAPLTSPVLLALQSAEIFTLTYGSMVRQLIADYEDVEEVNKQLDKMCVAAAVWERVFCQGSPLLACCNDNTWEPAWHCMQTHAYVLPPTAPTFLFSLAIVCSAWLPFGGAHHGEPRVHLPDALPSP